MSTLVTITAPLVAQTIAVLQTAGRQHREGVALWLGRRGGPVENVVEVIEPVHRAAMDFFHIPPAGMRQLLEHLGATGTAIIAQVHSHPRAAFHSPADDRWAVVRHLGALSVVLPDFAAAATVTNFLDIAAIFQLSAQNAWRPVDRRILSSLLEIR